jgi:hypothetical protein
MMHASLYGLGRFNVQVSDSLPKEEIGRRITWAHPLVQWLARSTQVRPYIIGEPIYRDQALVMGDRIIMSPAMYVALRKDASVLGAMTA